MAAGARGWTTKQLAWGCIGSFAAGAIALYAVGFHWVGQWQTGEEVAQKLAVAACVQDFLLQPDRGIVYTQLKGNYELVSAPSADSASATGRPIAMSQACATSRSSGWIPPFSRFRRPRTRKSKQPA